MTKEIAVSLLGHKDHGKSTLIGRLLYETKSITEDRIKETEQICKSMGKEFEFAFLLDSFVEEREGGFTLDTTMAQVRHDGVIYNMIDVPGHKELVKNMLSGASNAQAAILIISVKKDEGLQDETKLHIYLSRMLGLKKLIIAVNKMDIISYDKKEFEKIKSGLLDILVSFGYQKEKLVFVPLSAKEGSNIINRSKSMEWYKGKTMMELISECAHFDYDQEQRALPARLTVQDIYDLGSDSIVVGKVETGIIGKGEEIIVEPGAIAATISEIHNSGKTIEQAQAGQSVGVKFHDSKLKGIARGCVCMPEKDHVKAAQNFKVRIFCLPHSTLETNQEMELGAGAQETKARITGLYEKFNPITDPEPIKAAGISRIGPSEAAEATIETDNPIVLEKFSKIPQTGRFVLSKNGKIAGVGIVL